MRLFKKRKEPKPEPDAPGVQNVCARCGCSLHAPDSNRIVRIQGKTYCRACASQTLMTAVAPKQTCAMCRRHFPEPEMTEIGGRRLCKDCAAKPGADKMPFPNRQPQAGHVPQPAVKPRPSVPAHTKKPVPAGTVCVKCGKSVPTDGTAPHVGDKYYCADCYANLQERFRMMRLKIREEQIPQDHVNVLNAVLAQRVKGMELAERKRLEAERKRLAREQFYHTKCSACGAEHPRSMFHFVNDAFYCEACFEKLFSCAKKEDSQKDFFDKFRTEKPEPVPVRQYDRKAFMNVYKPAILPRLPQDMEAPQTQKAFLQTLEKVIPAVALSLTAEPELSALEQGTADQACCIGVIACRVNAAIGEADLDSIAAGWSVLPEELLLDAYILLDFYSFILSPEVSGYISAACAMLCGELLRRRPCGSRKPAVKTIV